MGLLPRHLPPHVLPVGRLDQGTEGLLLFSNDGEFAHRLAHPRFEIEKEYHALVDGVPSPDALDRLRRGVVIDGRPTAPAKVELTGAPQGHSERDGHAWLRITIHEGRKRQVRLMTAAVGHQTRTLVRTRIGPVALDGLPRMSTRPLTTKELRELRRLLSLEAT
jgi:23S rRNA pseudouridine2605 synthase